MKIISAISAPARDTQTAHPPEATAELGYDIDYAVDYDNEVDYEVDRDVPWPEV